MKPRGRPLKYDKNEKTVFSVQMPKAFREVYKNIVKLSEIDDNEKFVEYCKNVEGVDLSKLNQSKFSIYLRWIVSTHYIINIHKLQ